MDLKNMWTRVPKYLIIVCITLTLLSGVVKVHTDWLTIGEDRNNNQISNKISYINAFLNKEAQTLIKYHSEWNPFQIKYCLELCKTEILTHLALGYLSNTEEYLGVLSRSCLTLIQTNAGDNYIWSYDFEFYLYGRLSELLENLESINNKSVIN